MAKIPKIYGTSEVKTILAKLQNLVGQCCWAKTLNWQVKPMMALFHREEGKGRLPPPPQALYPPRRLLRSLKFGPKTIDFASAPEGNSWKKISMPWTNVAKIFDVFSSFQLILGLCGRIMFIWRRGEGGGGRGEGGGQLVRFWVGMCPGRTKMQTLNLGKTFHWKTPKTYGNDTNLRIFLHLMQKF